MLIKVYTIVASGSFLRELQVLLLTLETKQPTLLEFWVGISTNALMTTFIPLPCFGAAGRDRCVTKRTDHEQWQHPGPAPYPSLDLWTEPSATLRRRAQSSTWVISPPFPFLLLEHLLPTLMLISQQFLFQAPVASKRRYCCLHRKKKIKIILSGKKTIINLLRRSGLGSWDH